MKIPTSQSAEFNRALYNSGVEQAALLVENNMLAQKNELTSPSSIRALKVSSATHLVNGNPR